MPRTLDELLALYRRGPKRETSSEKAQYELASERYARDNALPLKKGEIDWSDLIFLLKSANRPTITKREAYRLGFYRFNPPPVPTAGWDEDAWIRYIGDNWTVPVLED
jgi:hypothetical protein